MQDGSMYGVSHEELVILFRLAVAVVCGALVGWERELHEKGAGFRTHMLICLGACIFTIIAAKMHADFGNADITRVVQGVVTAVGFIAGGLIFVSGTSIHGLTTAAGLWVLTGVGAAIGVGYYWVAIVGTLMAFVIIALLKRVARTIHDAAGKEPKE